MTRLDKMQLHRLDENILRHNRNIRTWLVCGGALMAGGLAYLFLLWQFQSLSAEWVGIGITAVVFGFLAVAVNLRLVGNLPEARQPSRAWENSTRPAPPIIHEISPGHFRRPVTDLSTAEWQQLCYVMKLHDGHWSRRVLQSGMDISNDRFTDLNAAMTRARIVANNEVVEGARGLFGLDER